MRLAVLGLALLAAVLAARVEPAQACSCALGDPRAALARADAAFVGTLVERRGPPVVESSAEPVTLVFRVERAVKGRLGRTIEVRTAASSASCGLELRVGQRTGLLLDRDGKTWLGTLCGQLSPATLVAAARPLPAPNGSGPAVLLAGGSFGPARTIALDRLGRTLAYGRGGGETQLLAVCPGSRRAAEVALGAAGWTVAVRDLRTLQALWSRRLPVADTAPPVALGCSDALGRTVDVFATSLGAPTGARLVRAGPGAVRTAWRGTATAASFAGGVAYVNRGPQGRDAVALDPATGRVTRIGRVPASTGPLAPEPGGPLLAGVAGSRLVLLDRRTGRVRTAPLGGPGGTVAWLADGRLASFPAGDPAEVRVYDRSLRLRSRIRPWRARAGVAAGAAVYGVGWLGEVTHAGLPRGPVRALRTLPSPVVRAFVAVPPR